MVEGPPYNGTGQADRDIAERLLGASDSEGVISQTLAEVDLKNGNQYIFRETFSRSKSTPALDILVENPSSAENALRVVERKIDPTKALTGTLSFNVDITTAGTDFRVAASRVTGDMSSPDTQARVEYGGSYDTSAGTADALPVDVFDAGVGAQRVTRDTSTAAFRMEPGTNVYYDLESQADGNDILVEFIVSQV